MFITQHKDKIELPKAITERYSLKDIAFFDIETTGFDKEKDSIILISLGYFSDYFEYTVKQYYADKLEQEKEILKEFGKDISSFNKWCSYNGIAFDEPFIVKRMNIYGIKTELPKEHVDLYRMIRPYYKQLGLERCNLKTVEKYIGVERKDKIDGGISVELYSEYLASGEKELREVIMLHNYEDVLNLPCIFKLINEVESNPSYRREGCISDKQLKYLKALLKNNKITLATDLTKVSKKAASRAIDYLLRGNKEIDELEKIINNSY